MGMLDVIKGNSRPMFPIPKPQYATQDEMNKRGAQIMARDATVPEPKIPTPLTHEQLKTQDVDGRLPEPLLDAPYPLKATEVTGTTPTITNTLKLTPLKEIATDTDKTLPPAKTVGIPTATGVKSNISAISQSIDNQGKVTGYSDTPALAQRPVELKPLTNTVGINGSVKTSPTAQQNELALTPLNIGTGAGGMNYSVPNTASKVGGSTDQERYALQQQELAQKPQQEGRGTVSLPPAQIGGVDVQEAIAKNMAIVNNASAAGNVGDLLKVKYAQRALDGYMGKDTANAGLQLKQIDQVQEQGKQKQAAVNEAWNRLIQGSQFNYGVQKDQQQFAAGERTAQAAHGLKLAELGDARNQHATTNALALKKLNQPITKAIRNIDGSEKVVLIDPNTRKILGDAEPTPEDES